MPLLQRLAWPERPVPAPTVSVTPVEVDYSILAAAKERAKIDPADVVLRGLVAMTERLHRERLS